MFELFIVFLVLIIAFAIAALLFMKNDIKNKQAANSSDCADFEKQILNSGFKIEKRIDRPDTSTLFFVDGTAKKWTVKTYQNNYGIMPFEDLLSFELVENNESVASATLNSIFIGGKMYENQKSIEATCSMMQIHVRLNNLQHPQIIIPIHITLAVKKNSEYYRNAITVAQEIIATLTYIQNNK